MATDELKNIETMYIQKIRNRLKEIQARFVCTDSVTIRDVDVAETAAHLLPSEAQQLRYSRLADGRRWGRPWGTAWFRVRARVPASFRGEPVLFRFRTGGECIVFREGTPVQALDRGRDTYRVLDRAVGGERIDLWIEAGANSDFGKFDKRTAFLPTLGVFNRDVWDAYWDLAALFDLIESLPAADTFRARIVFELNRAVDLFDYGRPDRQALRAQARRVRRALEPLYACRAAASAQTIACMGHAHIDVAWLWPLAESVRKCGRTFSNVVELMRRYPEFLFIQSQPALYEFTRDRYPALYQAIRAKARQGQWIPTGATWVEMDCNVTGGESLVRQILFGTRFFRREFGYRTNCLWLPDVFGYSAALPQILKRSGIDYFLTQKISWNRFTVFPYHSFWWEGIDGSRVLTHFPPANTYNAALTAGELLAAAQRYREKDRAPIQAIPFGYGDGGGGPTADMLERMRRYRNLDGMPKLQPMSPERFFDRLARYGKNLPRWVGELYFELHRGTYTTQAWNKAFNRQCEILLREAEMLSAFGLPAGGPYEQDALNRSWKTVLLNQFHDIIPGSSIGKVYEDSTRQYTEVIREVEGVRARAAAHLARAIDTRGDGKPFVVFNSLSWDRRDVAAVEAEGMRSSGPWVAVSPDGAETPVQFGPDGKARFVASVPSLGYSLYRLRRGRAVAPVLKASRRGLENERIRVDLDAQGRICRIVDRAAGRDVLEPGAIGNRLVLSEDKPTAWDAWEIDVFHNDKILERDGRLLALEVLEAGPVRAAVRVRRAISRSVLTQIVALHAGSPRIDFETTVEWGDEKDVLLKAAFPLNVRADRARYEIQYGNLERPTHWNRPSDLAMFEVPAQRWADLSEADYGVALLNTCKYGYDAKDNVLRLSLLRAPTHPDPKADVGKTHRFTYALFPHAGGYVNGVVRAGYELNMPPAAFPAARHGGRRPSRASWMAISNPNVVVDAVKKGEDDGGMVVRLYEAHGTRGPCGLRIGLPVWRAWETDLMERPERQLAVRDGRLTLAFGPFQIRTLKLYS